MTRLGFAKLAASTLAVGAMLAVSNPATGEKVRKADVEAAKHAAAAEKASAKGKHQAAIADAEQAVTLMPREPRYRLLLGQTYLSAGRFASAEATFADVLSLSPRESRAAISLTLAQIALGKSEAARETLYKHSDLIGAADQGLALALAGEPQAAVGILEQAARDPANGPRARQNLALAYAMAGRWTEAKVMASLDVAPDDLPRRLGEWAQLVQASSPMQQVSTLLGVTPTQDPGQPVALALAPQAAEPVMLADAAPVVAPPPPVAMAESTFNSAGSSIAPTPNAVDISEYAGVKLAERAEVAQPVSVAKSVQWAAAKPATPKLLRKPAPARFIPASKLVEGGKFVVQLGAYSAPDRVERAWDMAVARNGGLAEFTPSSTTFVPKPGSKTLYRLSVGGFATRADAVRTCATLRANGGACFVRGTAGDAVPQWALARKRQQLASR